MQWDIELTKYISSFSGGSNLLDSIGLFCSSYLIVFIGVFAVLWVLYKSSQKNKIKHLIVFLLSSGVVFCVNFLIKIAIGRSRPFEQVADTPLAELLFHTPAFPSGHTAVAFALATLVFLHDKKAGVVVGIFAFFVAWSRIFVGVHFVSDILAGIAVGIVVSFCVHKLITNNWKV
ncbi:MAG: phosphatase PAP2 family protein [Patescibacteria group bacterium]